MDEPLRDKSSIDILYIFFYIARYASQKRKKEKEIIDSRILAILRGIYTYESLKIFDADFIRKLVDFLLNK